MCSLGIQSQGANMRSDEKLPVEYGERWEGVGGATRLQAHVFVFVKSRHGAWPRGRGGASRQKLINRCVWFDTFFQRLVSVWKKHKVTPESCNIHTAVKVDAEKMTLSFR